MGVTRIFSQKHYCEIYRLLETRVNIEMLLTILLTAIDYAVNTNYFTFTNTGVIVEANKQIHSQATQLMWTPPVSTTNLLNKRNKCVLMCEL